MMAAVYKQTERFGRRELFLREKVRYAPPTSRRMSSKVYSAVGDLPVIKDEVAARFQELAQKWLAETRYVSSITQVVLHFAYQQIIGMGPIVLPLIFRQLAAEPNHWFWALSAITGANPVTDAELGDVHKMRDVWLEWARERGYM